MAYRPITPEARGYEDSSTYAIARPRPVFLRKPTQNDRYDPFTEALNRALETFSGGGVGVGTHLDQKKLLWGA